VIRSYASSHNQPHDVVEVNTWLKRWAEGRKGEDGVKVNQELNLDERAENGRNLGRTIPQTHLLFLKISQYRSPDTRGLSYNHLSVTPTGRLAGSVSWDVEQSMPHPEVFGGSVALNGGLFFICHTSGGFISYRPRCLSIFFMTSSSFISLIAFIFLEHFEQVWGSTSYIFWIRRV